MFSDRNAQSVVEYIVILAIFIALAGTALYSIFTSLRNKFEDVNTAINTN